MSQTLLHAQTNALVTLLNLGQNPAASAASASSSARPGTPAQDGTDVLPFEAAKQGPLIWKVLVLDEQSKDVLATSLRVQDLREQGVTLHMQLHSARPPLSDVPAIYFVSPTSYNVKRIALDISQGLYSSYYLSFTSTLPKALMEEFASQLLTYDASGSLSDQVAGIWDQHLDFIVPSPSLFSLLPKRVPVSDTSADNASSTGRRNKDKDLVPPKETDAPPSYSILNSPSATEADIEAESERISRGLFSVVVTQGTIPIIRAPRGNAAEMVARKLDAKLRDWATSGGAGGRGGQGGGDGLGGLNRPREFDYLCLCVYSD